MDERRCVGQQTSSMEAIPGLKQDKLKALATFVPVGCRFEGKLPHNFNCCNFCSSKWPEGTCMTRHVMKH